MVTAPLLPKCALRHSYWPDRWDHSGGRMAIIQGNPMQIHLGSGAATKQPPDSPVATWCTLPWSSRRALPDAIEADRLDHAEADLHQGLEEAREPRASPTLRRAGDDQFAAEAARASVVFGMSSLRFMRIGKRNCAIAANTLCSGSSILPIPCAVMSATNTSIMSVTG